MSLEIENILKEDPIEKTADSCYFKGVLKAETIVNIQTPIQMPKLEELAPQALDPGSFRR